MTAQAEKGNKLTQNVTLVVATKDQAFPANTVDSLFTFTIKNADGSVRSSVDVAQPSAFFADVEDGDYSAEVTKNGVTVAKPFSVQTPPPSDVTLQVPDTLTVTFA